MGTSAENVNTEVTGTRREENEKPETNPYEFEALTVDDTILIASSSQAMEGLPIEMKCRYRKLVERLMKNTGIIFGDESMRRENTRGIDTKQRGLLKSKVIPDFRRQTKVEGINDEIPINPDCNLEGCSENF